MSKLALYDPPMCCSTGVCGPAVDPTLPRVSADLEWLKRQGIQVERYNLAQQPQAFASNPTVTAALREHGNDCLPLVLVDGKVASLGTYPDRAELSRLAGLACAPEGGTPKEAASSCCCAPEGGTPKEAASSCCSSPGVVRIGGGGRSSGKCC